MAPGLYWCVLLWSCMQSLLIACEQCGYILVLGSVDGQMCCTSECPLPRRCLGQSDLSIFGHFSILQLEPSCIATTWIVVLLLLTPPHIAFFYHRSVDHTIGFHLWKLIGWVVVHEIPCLTTSPMNVHVPAWYSASCELAELHMLLNLIGGYVAHPQVSRTSTASLVVGNQSNCAAGQSWTFMMAGPLRADW